MQYKCMNNDIYKLANDNMKWANNDLPLQRYE